MVKIIKDSIMSVQIVHRSMRIPLQAKFDCAFPAVSEGRSLYSLLSGSNLHSSPPSHVTLHPSQPHSHHHTQIPSLGSKLEQGE